MPTVAQTGGPQHPTAGQGGGSGSGATMRDHFAGIAMDSIIRNNPIDPADTTLTGTKATVFANAAYIYAAAMITRRAT